jgi:hypothetical protein
VFCQSYLLRTMLTLSVARTLVSAASRLVSTHFGPRPKCREGFHSFTG